MTTPFLDMLIVYMLACVIVPSMVLWISVIGMLLFRIGTRLWKWIKTGA